MIWARRFNLDVSDALEMVVCVAIWYSKVKVNNARVLSLSMRNDVTMIQKTACNQE